MSEPVTQFKQPFLNDYANKLLEAHETPADIIDDMCGEPIFWLNTAECPSKVVESDTRLARRMYGIGDSPE